MERVRVRAAQGGPKGASNAPHIATPVAPGFLRWEAANQRHVYAWRPPAVCEASLDHS